MSFNYGAAAGAAKGFNLDPTSIFGDVIKRAKAQQDKERNRKDIENALGNVYNLPRDQIAGLAGMYQEGIPVPDTLIDAAINGSMIEETIKTFPENVQGHLRTLPPAMRNKVVQALALDQTGRAVEQASNEVARVESVGKWNNLAPNLPKTADGKIDWNKVSPDQYSEAIAVANTMIPGNSETAQRQRNVLMYGQPEPPGVKGKLPEIFGGMNANDLQMAADFGAFQGTMQDAIRVAPLLYAYYLSMPGTNKSEEDWAAKHGNEFMGWDKALVTAEKSISERVQTTTGRAPFVLFQSINEGTATAEQMGIVDKYYVRGDDGEYRVRQSVIFQEAEKIQRMAQFLAAKSRLKGYPRQFANDLFALVQAGNGAWDATYDQQLRDKGYDELDIANFKRGLQAISSGYFNEVMQEIGNAQPAPESIPGAQLKTTMKQ